MGNRIAKWPALKHSYQCFDCTFLSAVKLKIIVKVKMNSKNRKKKRVSRVLRLRKKNWQEQSEARKTGGRRQKKRRQIGETIESGSGMRCVEVVSESRQGKREGTAFTTLTGHTINRKKAPVEPFRRASWRLLWQRPPIAKTKYSGVIETSLESDWIRNCFMRFPQYLHIFCDEICVFVIEQKQSFPRTELVICLHFLFICSFQEI